jgi:hypothetical protein
MLYREIITSFSQIHTKHINILCGQNVEFVLSLDLAFKPLTDDNDSRCVWIEMYVIGT